MKIKLIVFILIIIAFSSCNNSYKTEEETLIEDLTNDYLKRNHLSRILNPIRFLDADTVEKPNIDTLDLKVYISDALLPISQIKEDNEWMFDDNDLTTGDSVIFQEIINSQTFNRLEYREFKKSLIKLEKPYSQFDKRPNETRLLEEYTIFSFSRVCFDSDKQNAVVVIDFDKGFSNGTMSGYNMALLVKKENGLWKYVEY